MYDKFYEVYNNCYDFIAKISVVSNSINLLVTPRDTFCHGVLYGCSHGPLTKMSWLIPGWNTLSNNHIEINNYIIHLAITLYPKWYNKKI